jgi:hypothetical protein
MAPKMLSVAKWKINLFQDGADLSAMLSARSKGIVWTQQAQMTPVRTPERLPEAFYPLLINFIPSAPRRPGGMG